MYNTISNTGVPATLFAPLYKVSLYNKAQGARGRVAETRRCWPFVAAFCRSAVSVVPRNESLWGLCHRRGRRARGWSGPPCYFRCEGARCHRWI